MSKQKQEDLFEEEMIDYVITEKDLLMHPEFVEEGIEVGDTISIPKEQLEDYKQETIEQELSEKELEPELEPVVAEVVTNEATAKLPSWARTKETVATEEEVRKLLEIPEEKPVFRGETIPDWAK